MSERNPAEELKDIADEMHSLAREMEETKEPEVVEAAKKVRRLADQYWELAERAREQGLG